MTGYQSRGLRIGARVRWGENKNDLGTVTEKNWSGVRSRSGRGKQLCVPPPNGSDRFLWTICFGLLLSATSTVTRQPSRHAQ